MDSKAWTLGLVAVAMAVVFAELGWLAEASAEDQAAATRAAGWGLLALVVHAVSAPAVAWFAGKIDRRTDPQDRADGAVLLTVVLAGLGAVAAGVGAAVLPGPWHAAAPVAITAGLIAIVLSWTTVPAVRRADFEAALPGARGTLVPLLLLPAAVAVGVLARLVVRLLSEGS